MSDIFELYQKGVDHLIEEIGEDHVDYDKVLDQRYRLIENIEKTERYGDNPQLQSERSEILHNLDNIARSALKKPFHTFYDSSPSHKPPSKEHHDRESISPKQVTSIQPVMSQPWPDPQMNGDYNRQIILEIEYALDTSPLHLTGDFIETLTNRINDVHIWLRSPAASAATYNAGLTVVLSYLRDARTKFMLALEEYRRRGQTEKFFNNIESGRELLERAISAW